MKKKILVIEDDELLNSGLCYNIQKHDMTPYSAYGVEDVRSSLRAETFDLILLDVNLPDGSGFDLAKEIAFLCGGDDLHTFIHFYLLPEKTESVPAGGTDSE